MVEPYFAGNAVEGDEVEVMGTRPLVERYYLQKITADKEAIQSLPIRDMSELYSLQSGVVKVESKTRGIPNQEERGWKKSMLEVVGQERSPT